jgi:ClpP class serine protease
MLAGYSKEPVAIKESVLDGKLNELINNPLLKASALDELLGLEVEPLTLSVDNGIGIIEIKGVIGKNLDAIDKIFYSGVDTVEVSKLVIEALNNPEIEAILLDIDSPGGSVNGTMELGDLIRDAKKQKPVMAYTDGMMCSAAYWIGSQANCR